MAYYDPTRDRKLMEKRSNNLGKRTSPEISLPLSFESQVDKNGLAIYKGFVLLPGTITDNIQQLKLHLPTGHVYCVKNDHCATNSCPGMFNRRSHNAHPIHSRVKMHLEAFRWQVCLFLLHEGGRVSPRKAIEICYQDWPLELEKTPVKLYECLKTSLYTFYRASKEENEESTFMKKSFLQEYPQKKLDRLIAALRLDTHYWGPYTAPKPTEGLGVDKENSVVSTGKRRRENVSPLRNSGSVEKEMNPKKKPRQETDKDPKGIKTFCLLVNAKAKNGNKISSKSKDKVSHRISEGENKSLRKEKRSRDGSKKKRNSDSESKSSRNIVRTSTPNEKGGAGLYGEPETLSPKGNSIPSSAELSPMSGLEVSRESVESADLTEVRRLLEEVRLEAERKSREADHLKKALAHLLSYRIESEGSKLSQEKIDTIIQLDGKISDELLNISCPNQPQEMTNKLPVVSVSLSDSVLPSCSPDNSFSTNYLNPESSFRNGKPWDPLLRRCLLPKDEPAKKIRFAETSIKRSTKIFNQNGMDVFAVPLSSKKSIEQSSVFERFVFGKANGRKEHRTILVLGANDSERRKFIDGVINFIFNVEKEDKFRFQLIKEEDATETTCIKVYDIHHCEGFSIPFSLTIVDTPSYDSYPEELEIFKDKEIIETFHDFFENRESVEQLDMICNVGDEICPSFLSGFANDLEENIHCFQPSDHMTNTWRDDIQSFVNLLSTMKPKSLSLTKQILSERKRLESTVYEIRSLITTGLTMTEEMITAKQMASNCQTYLQQFVKDFQTEVNQEAAQKVEQLECVQQSHLKRNSEVKSKWENVYSTVLDMVDVLQEKISLNCQSILERFQAIENCISLLDEISCGESLLTRKLISFHFFDAEPQLNRLGLMEKFINLKTLFN